MSVTNLVWKLVGNAGPLVAELQKAEKEVVKFNKRASSEIAKIGKAFGAAGAAAASGFAVMVQSSINTADNLQKMSDRVGLAVEDVSALAFIAEQSGTSIQNLEKPLNVFAQSLAGTGKQSAKFTEALQKIGVETRNADGELRPTLDVFKDISEEFSNLETGAEKTALAADVFGTRYGPQLVNLLNQGKDGIEALTAQAEQLGLVISEDTGRSAEIFNDNLNVLRKTFTGVANQVAAQILPTLVNYSNKSVDSANDTQVLAGRVQFISNVFKTFLSILEVVTATLKNVGNTIGGVAAAIVAAATGNFRGAVAIIKELGTDIATTAKDAFENVKDIWADAPPIAQAARQTGEVTGKSFSEGILSTTSRIKDAIKTPFDEAAAEAQKFIEESNALFEQWWTTQENRGRQVTQSVRTEQELYNETVAELKELLDGLFISQETYDRALQKAQSSLRSNTEETKAFKDEVTETRNEVNEFAKQGADRAFDIFADAFFNPMQKGFSGILDSFVNMLRDMALQALKQQVLQAFFGGGAAVAGAAVGGGGGGGIVSTIGSAIAGGLSTRGSALEYHDSGMGGARSDTATRSSALNQQLSVTNVNVVDPSMVQQMLMTPEGQRAVLNVVRASREVIL